jgi:hypothetical protein
MTRARLQRAAYYANQENSYGLYMGNRGVSDNYLSDYRGDDAACDLLGGNKNTMEYILAIAACLMFMGTMIRFCVH